jgi:RND family efflux transporter MFP subunit
MIAWRSALACAWATALACHRSADDAPMPPPAVHAELVRTGETPTLMLRGPVVAGTRLRLGFKSGGVIGDVHVTAGSPVHKGQVLAELDATDASAHQRAAQAARDKAARDYRRAANLVDKGALAPVSRDDARSALTAADANLAIAVDAAKRTRIVSPIEGTVYKRTGEPGETVAPGATVLVVEDTARPTVRLGVTDADLRQVTVAQPASVLVEGQAAIAARVTSVASTPDAADGLYTVEVTPVEGHGQRLQVGVLSMVSFVLERDNSITVPLDAVVHRRDKDWLFVVDPAWDLSAGSDPVVTMRPVVLGRSRGRRVTVASGLRAGERFVSEGAYFLGDGQPVRVVGTAAQVADR